MGNASPQRGWVSPLADGKEVHGYQDWSEVPLDASETSSDLLSSFERLVKAPESAATLDVRALLKNMGSLVSSEHLPTLRALCRNQFRPCCPVSGSRSFITLNELRFVPWVVVQTFSQDQFHHLGQEKCVGPYAIPRRSLAFPLSENETQPRDYTELWSTLATHLRYEGEEEEKSLDAGYSVLRDVKDGQTLVVDCSASCLHTGDRTVMAQALLGPPCETLPKEWQGTTLYPCEHGCSVSSDHPLPFSSTAYPETGVPRLPRGDFYSHQRKLKNLASGQYGYSFAKGFEEVPEEVSSDRVFLPPHRDWEAEQKWTVPRSNETTVSKGVTVVSVLPSTHSRVHKRQSVPEGSYLSALLRWPGTQHIPEVCLHGVPTPWSPIAVTVANERALNRTGLRLCMEIEGTVPHSGMEMSSPGLTTSGMNQAFHLRAFDRISVNLVTFLRLVFPALYSGVFDSGRNCFSPVTSLEFGPDEAVGHLPALSWEVGTARAVSLLDGVEEGDMTELEAEPCARMVSQTEWHIRLGDLSHQPGRCVKPWVLLEPRLTTVSDQYLHDMCAQFCSASVSYVQAPVNEVVVHHQNHTLTSNMALFLGRFQQHLESHGSTLSLRP